MKSLKIRLLKRGQVELHEEIHKLLLFLEKNIHKTYPIDDFTIEVEFEKITISEDELKYIVLDYVSGYKNFKTKHYLQSDNKECDCITPHDFDNIEIAEGVRLRSGDYYRFSKFLQFKIDEIFCNENSTRLSVPAMISRLVIERVEYFKKFPNLVNFVSHLKKDYTLIKKISSERINEINFMSITNISEKVLNPVTCYHIYPNAQYLYERYKKKYFVIDGTAFRYESNNTNRNRLNEFQIHEIVLFGKKNEVLEKRHDLLNEISKLFNSWEICFSATSASDTFYSNDASIYMSTQKLDESKIELKAKNDMGENSFASFNFHGSYYTNIFGIEMDEIDLTSGCVGIGIERAIYTIYSQLGQNIDNWPVVLKKEYLS